jgi:hypothetical protein
MARRNGNKSFNQIRNRGNHQRARTTRGCRKISKFIKYKWYTEVDARGEPFIGKEGES